jgi:hypothetical protein
MTAPHASQIVDGYLARLEAELADLPPTRHRELVDDVRAHIVEARAALSEESDAGLLNIVERLGDPAVVAAEARERLGIPAFRPGLQEIGGLALLILPLPWPPLWLVGAALVWRSTAWTQREKLIGTAAPLVPLVIFLATLTLPLGGLGHWWLLFFWVSPLGAVFLAIRLWQRHTGRRPTRH